MKIKELLETFISSYKTSIVLLIIYALALGVATFVEHYLGTETAKVFFYYSPLLILLQVLLVINFLATSVKYKLFTRSKLGFMITHVAFIIILFGALVTHLMSEEGTLHLRENDSADKILVQTNRGHYFHKLPFEVQLKKFNLTRYPGSSSPASFESLLQIKVDGNTYEEIISMNNVIDLKGYRLFQASYDKDELGSILSVNKDVTGRNITYTGYLLLIIGFGMCFIGKNSRFSQLIRKLKGLRVTPVIIMILLSSTFIQTIDANGGNESISDAVLENTIPLEHADKFGRLPMQAIDGRMKPINTFSSEILRKLHKSDHIYGLNSDQFLLSLISMPDMWMKVPFIVFSNKDIAFNFDITNGECSYSELFDSNGHYKLQREIDDAYKKAPAERNQFDKDLIKLDGQVNVFFQLANFRMLNIFPVKDDTMHKWYAAGDDFEGISPEQRIAFTSLMPHYLRSIQNSLKTGDWTKSDEMLTSIATYQTENNTTLNISPQKIDAELKINKLDIFRYNKIFYLILGGLLLLVSFISLFKTQKGLRYIMWLLVSAIFLVALSHIYGLAMRGYIAGYAPWSNAYETMIYVSLITVLGGLLFVRQSVMTFALSTLFGGVILFVSGLNWMDPQINSLMPVLNSPWLMIHVAVIVAAYGFFGICCLLGINNLILLVLNKNKKQILSLRIDELTIVNEMAMWIGLALMTIGTFLGAVWANESWGRYWGWDSKETWALITVVVYAIVTHLRLVKKYDKQWIFNLLAILAFLSVLMTYFGVNYYLTGLHSYA